MNSLAFRSERPLSPRRFAQFLNAVIASHGPRLLRYKGVLNLLGQDRKVILQGRSSREMRVREIMTAPVVTVSTEDTVDDCMRIMTEHRIRHLPVVDDMRRLHGIISIGDLNAYEAHDHELTIHVLHEHA